MKLHVGDATLRFLAAQNVTVYVAETREAVGIYNSLAEAGSLVGGFFYSTC